VSDRTLEETILPVFGRTHHMISRFMKNKLKEYEIPLSKEQIIVLSKLHKKDGQTQNELAECIHRDKTSLTRILNKLEQKELAIRVRDKEDKRVNKIYITQSGQTMFKRVIPILQSVSTMIESWLSETETQLLKETSEKIQNQLQSIIK